MLAIMGTLGLCLLAVVITAANPHKNIRQYVLSSLPDICPYNDFCKQPATELLSDNTKAPCCIPCSCDDKCLQFNNCCLDKEFSDSTKDHQTTHPVCMEPTIQRGASGVRENKKYQVIDYCPEDGSDKNYMQNCNNPNLTTFENMFWVSDTKTGQIFKNKFCATCHGVYEFIYWNLGIFGCEENITYNVSIETLLQHPKCSLWLRPPRGLSLLVTTYFCFENAITTCNVSGRWKQYNKTIEEACNLFQMPFVTETITGSIMNAYKNIYCSMCNEWQRNPVDLCESISGKTDVLPFTALFDFDLYVKATENSQTKCNVDEIVDKVLNFCHRLFCPLGQIPSGGMCLTKAITFPNTAIDVVYSVKLFRNSSKELNIFETGQNVDEAGQNALEARIADKFYLIRQELGFETLGCTVKHLNLYVRTDTQDTSFKDYLLFGEILTTQRCDIHSLQVKMVELLGKEVIIDLDNHIVFQIGDIHKESYGLLINKNGYITGVSYPVTGTKSFRLVMDKICPRLKLKRSVILGLPLTETKNRLLSLFTNNDETGQQLDEVEICVDDYFDILSDISGAPTLGLAHVLKYLVISCIMTNSLVHLNYCYDLFLQ